MRVTMLTNRRVTPDGVNTIDAEAGETYTMGDGVAHSLITRGLAEPADGTPSPEISNENKDAGAAPENQASGDAAATKVDVDELLARIQALSSNKDADALAIELGLTFPDSVKFAAKKDFLRVYAQERAAGA